MNGPFGSVNGPSGFVDPSLTPILYIPFVYLIVSEMIFRSCWFHDMCIEKDFGITFPQEELS